MSSSSSPEQDSHVGCLDGLRGLAAAWVFLSHAQILSGLRPLPVLAWGDLAVDLFMMISGFLMAHNYQARSAREPWQSWSTWRAFWVRRFFRIAPAYYLLLALALVMGPMLGSYRAVIGEHFPQTVTPAARYFDSSLSNVWYHVTFLFGTLPNYAFRTPLPDWSIGLEMQFYAVFPLLMLAMGPVFKLWRQVLVFALALGMYLLSRGHASQFEMPAFLPLKLHVFLLGIALAYAKRGRAVLGPWLMVGLVCSYVLYKRPDVHGVSFALTAAGFGLLVSSPSKSRLLHRVREALSSAPGRLAGDYAYSFYLVHLLLLIPVAGLLISNAWYLALSPLLRFVICAVVAGMASLVLCALLHRFVEQPGIRFGKWLLGRRRPVAHPTSIHGRTD